MGKEDADGYVRVKIDVDTSHEKEIKRSLEDIQDDADNAKRKLDALKETGVDENAKAYRKAAEDLEKYNKEIDEYVRKQKEAETAAASRTKTTRTGDFDSISDQVEDYETRLRMLRNKGYGPGDEHFDELYIAWKNASMGIIQARKIPPRKKPPRFARSGYCYPQRFHISCTYSTSMSSNASSPFFASAFASPWRTKHIVTKLRAEKIAA